VYDARCGYLLEVPILLGKEQGKSCRRKRWLDKNGVERSTKSVGKHIGSKLKRYTLGQNACKMQGAVIVGSVPILLGKAQGKSCRGRSWQKHSVTERSTEND